MSDSFRTDSSRAIDIASDGDRDAKIELLLLNGLDHYFAARYEQAINVWTRALFLDRSHPRARAYIDRARSALAERQRESEELLQKGVAAFDRGEREEAKRLLHAAIDGGAPADEAHALLGRLSRAQTSRLSRTRVDEIPRPDDTLLAGTSLDAAPDASSTGSKRRSHLRRGIIGLIAAGALIGGVIEYPGTRANWLSLFGGQDSPVSSTVVPVSREVVLPLPRRGEMALERARSLATSGRLHEALKVLDLVRPTDVERAEADRVRGDIQRQLLELVTLPRSSPARERDAGREP
jgi:tetratricopeptide (TPR) repeat protein